MGTASPLPANPSNALAGIAAALVGFNVTDSATLARRLDALRPTADPPEEWLLPAMDLCRSVVNALGGTWPPKIPTDINSFVAYAIELQRLDRWHTPVLPTAIEFQKSAEHEQVLDRYAVTGRFNSNWRTGTVIQRESPDTPFVRAEAELDWNDNPDAFAIVNLLLEVCSFLPAPVSGDDPDDENNRNTRDIALCFRHFPAGSTPLRQFRNDLRIAVAPVLEAATDARLWVNRNRYSVHPRIPKSRLVAIVREAIANRADLLLMPEMSVDQRLLKFLRAAVVEERQTHYRATAELPRLAFVVCGVLQKRSLRRGIHRNYVAVIDQDGSVLLEQDKLSHWNLGEAAQSRFGLLGKYPVPLLEDTQPGNSITIAELPGLGRLLTLICADLSANQPGDWIAENIGIDWLHAPIMDGSSCWTQPRVPWAIRRAERAAGAGTAAVVTNSMALTFWNNQVIARESAKDAAYPYRIYTECGIALAVLPRADSIKMQHVTEPMPPRRSPVVHLIDWSGGWDDFP